MRTNKLLSDTCKDVIKPEDIDEETFRLNRALFTPLKI